MGKLLQDGKLFVRHVEDRLYSLTRSVSQYENQSIIDFDDTSSAVLMLLGFHSDSQLSPAEPTLILNKRSQEMRQPGDLCCPGGRVAPRMDRFLSRFLKAPFSPLGRWVHWGEFKRRHPGNAQLLSLYLATGLRESFEEMRLNPLRVKFLGSLPPQRLVMFKRVIFPLVCWVTDQKTFHPNREVDKIIHIPLRDLLDPARYFRYRLSWKAELSPGFDSGFRDYPCFQCRTEKATELLWGATYQMTTDFLEAIFQFQPPPLESLPVVRGKLGQNYLTGN